MLKEGETVIIRGNMGLNSVRYDKLNRKRGVIEKIVYSGGHPIAAYVKLKRNKNNDSILIPINSLEGISTVNHIRTLNLLRNTKL